MVNLQKSEGLSKLLSALLKAQLEFGTVTKSSQAYQYKYADLAQVTEKVTPALNQNELVIIQLPASSADQIGVTTILAHSSGEYLGQTFTTQLDKLDPQKVGSALTYYRRYGLMAVLGIAPEDDDAASLKPKTTPLNGKKPFKLGTVTKEDLVKQIQVAAGKNGWTPTDVKASIKRLGGKLAKDLGVPRLQVLLEEVQSKEMVDPHEQGLQ